MPTRFKYTSVPVSSYGLNPVDILLADDRDLNEYVGLKKLAPYRKGGDRWDPNRAQKLKEFRQKLFSKGVDTPGDDGEERKEKKRKGKKERMREKAAMEASGKEATEVEYHLGLRKRDSEGHSEDDRDHTRTKTRRRKRSGHDDDNVVTDT